MVKQRGKAGVWYARIDIKDEATGKRKQQWVRLPNAKNEREAKRAEARLITEREAGTLKKPTRETVAEFLRTWVQGHKTQIQANTWERYCELIENNLIPHLGHFPLAQLKAEEIRAAYSRMEAGGGSAVRVA